MAKGKNQKMNRKGKGNRKNEKHAFVKKEWFKVLSPPGLNGSRQIGWTPINKTQGTKVSTNEIKGRVAEMSYADITDQSKELGRSLEKRIKILVEDATKDRVFTSFHGYELAKERVYFNFKKRQSVFEAFVDVKTNDLQILRIFVIAITTRGAKQLKTNSYVHSSIIKMARKKIVDKLTKEAKDKSTNEIAKKVLDETLNSDLQNELKKLLPNLTVLVKKIKVLKKAKTDIRKLQEDSKIKETEKKTLNKDVPEDEKNQIDQ